MFTIEAFNPDICVETLKLSDKLFHNALKRKPLTHDRFHVKNSKGDDFDIVYLDNDEDIEPRGVYPDYVKPPYIAKYLYYDETDKATMFLGFFDGLKDMVFEELNEYTIVLTKVVLEFTKMNVWCCDERIYWFVDANERLHVEKELPDNIYEETCFYIQSAIRTGLEDYNFNILSSTYAFHNLFFVQDILGRRNFKHFHYITAEITNVDGVGSILQSYMRFKNAFGYFGLKFVAPNKETIGRYPKDLMERCFELKLWDEKSNKFNTLVIPLYIAKTKFFQMQPSDIDTSIIASDFIKEMDEYYDAIFGDKKTLGILIRGSDYIATGLSGTRKMATVEQMLPRIKAWMSDYGYEKIFLATEDADILKQMRKEFGKSMVALSQERFSASTLKQGQIISDYEKEQNTEDYNEALSDTTVNYFYALYLLSRCNAFLCSGLCNGWNTVLSLNAGKFERSYKFAVGINDDPRTENFEILRPITAGMFARGCYPTDKVFFLTNRFDMKEPVKPELVREAWDKTMKVYPYMSHAVVMRDKRLMLAKNPLPFVVEETSEVIEPSCPKGNFHFVTFGYLGNTLWIYIDHVPIDGTGYMRVLETFFYYYYCLYDNRVYEVPEGVYTEKDGEVPGQDVDAYLMEETVSADALMAANTDPAPSFVMPEAPRKGAFIPKADCRAFCISVPHDEFMAYAKSVKGSPMSVLAMLFAKAMERVHPENELPIRFAMPVSIRKVMGNDTSLLHQVVHAAYDFSPEILSSQDDEMLNTQFRDFMKNFASEANIKMMCGVYRGICEGYTEAFIHGMLNTIVMNQRENMEASSGVSYLGTLKSAEYGSRMRMTVAHAMQEKGVMLQMAEVGNVFFINWYQGFSGEMYVRALRDLLKEAGIKTVVIERTE